MSNLETAFYTLALTRVRGVGSVIGKRLIDFFSSAKQVFLADRVKIEQVAGKFVSENIKKFDKWASVEDSLRLSLKLGQNFVCYEEKDRYPALLAKIPDPPLVLFYKGNLEVNALVVAIVGTRKPSSYGIEATRFFSTALSSFGICIASGLAFGLDTVAHKSCVEASGKTYAIFPSSLENIYPYENKKLVDDILRKNGAILSEFPPGTMPSAENFPRRNRIIAGISKAVLIVEAPEKSGALITAYMAIDYDRDVFVVPGSIFSKTSKGTNRLIKEGAFLAETPEDIISRIIPDLGQKQPLNQIGLISPFVNIKRADLTESEEKILSFLSEDISMHIDDIIKKTQIAPQDVISSLISLEIKGVVVEEVSGYYKKAPSS